MPAGRSIASLTLSFGLVAIPVKLYSARESNEGVSFKMLAKDGSRLQQQYISQKTKKVVPREDMVKGYEFEENRFVLFTPDELKKLEEGSSHVIEIVAFIPEKSVDPLFYDKAYLLAPDKRGGKPYALLKEAMRKSGRCALAKWAWRAKQYVVQVRAHEDGLVLQQLLYAEEVRSLRALEIEQVAVPAAELQLALQLIDQITEESYDPTQYKDEEKARVLAEIDRKIAGKEIVASEHQEDTAAGGGQIIDLMDALRASLGNKVGGGKAGKASANAAAPSEAANVTMLQEARDRKTVKRATPKPTPEVSAPASSRRTKK